MRKMLTSCRRCNAKRSIDHHPDRDDQFYLGSVSAGRVSGDTYNLRIVRWVLSPQHEIILCWSEPRRRGYGRDDMCPTWVNPWEGRRHGDDDTTTLTVRFNDDTTNMMK